MGTMNNMRENTGIVLWILVISFGGLWVLQDSGVFDTLGANPLGKVIVVDGTPITSEEYQRQLEAQLEQIRQITGESVEPERLEAERERAFNLLVENNLRQKEMDRLGITVSEAEIQNLIAGDDPHEIIRAYFPSEDGGIDRALLQNFIDDPEQETTWIQLEEFIRLDRRRAKFDALVGAAIRVSEPDIEAEYDLGETVNSVEYFYLRYADVPDSAVTLSDRDLRRFYDEHREEYLRERVYSIELAAISKLPVREDTSAILREAERLLPDFEAAEDDSLFLAESGSAEPLQDRFYDASELDAGVTALLFENDTDLRTGLTVGPVVGSDAVHIVKVLETRAAEDVNVRARHILVNIERDEAAARELMDDIRRRILAGEDFADLAREFSHDPGSGSRGGDLGWFGPGTMVESFEDAAAAADVGELAGPVKTNFGLHLIEVTHRAETEVRIADLAIPLEASVATLDAAQETLDDLRYYAEESGDFAGETSRRRLRLETLQMQEGQVDIPGFGASRATARFLETADVGNISPIVELNEMSIMVHVVDIEGKGYPPLEEVESGVRPRALLSKKKEMQRNRLEDAYAADGFDGLAGALGMSAESESRVSFDFHMISGLGRDAVLAGAVFPLAEGEDTGVMEGTNAAFVARVAAKTTPAPLDDGDRNRIRRRLSGNRESVLRNGWITALREKAEVQDLRTDILQR